MRTKYFILNADNTKQSINGDLLVVNGYKYGVAKNTKLKRYVITDITTGMKVTSVEHKENALEVIKNMKDKLEDIRKTEKYAKYIKQLQEAKWVF